MPKRGENIRKRKDGRWEGRYKIGISETGKTMYRSIYGKSYAEVKTKLREVISFSKETAVKSKRMEKRFSEVLHLWFACIESAKKRLPFTDMNTS